MALTEQERQIVQYGKEQGKSKQQVMAALSQYRMQQSPQEKRSGFLAAVKDAPSDIGEAFTGAVDATTEGIMTGREATRQLEAGEISRGQRTLRTLGAGFKAGAGVVGEGVLGIAKIFTSPETEKQVSEAVGDIGESIGKTEIAQDLVNKYQSLDPEAQKDVSAVLGIAEGLGEIGAAGLVSRLSKPAIRAALSVTDEAVSKTKRAAAGIFSGGKRTANTVEETFDVAEDALRQQPDLAPSSLRATAEGEAPRMGLREKYIGLTPDVKKRLQTAGPEKTQDYIDIAVARNFDDTAPTPLGYGAQQVDRTVSKMEQRLSDTGSNIGQTRQKLGSVKASIDQVNDIERRFNDELEKLNLQVRGDQVQQIPGTVAKTQSKSDINALNDLWEQMKTVKESPTLTNLIDLRGQFDGRIKFGKQVQEVSNSVDPLSRGVRSSIADKAAEIVGPTEAARLKEFSEYMDALNNLKSYTDRRAGGEYLLRLVRSGRGDEARDIIETVKTHTGDDLMNDATLSTVVTEMLGNDSTKTLFQQEAANAGLETVEALRGSPSGIANVMRRIYEASGDTEKTLRGAAEPD